MWGCFYVDDGVDHIQVKFQASPQLSGPNIRAATEALVSKCSALLEEAGQGDAQVVGFLGENGDVLHPMVFFRHPEMIIDRVFKILTTEGVLNLGAAEDNADETPVTHEDGELEPEDEPGPDEIPIHPWPTENQWAGEEHLSVPVGRDFDRPETPSDCENGEEDRLLVERFNHEPDSDLAGNAQTSPVNRPSSPTPYSPDNLTQEQDMAPGLTASFSTLSRSSHDTGAEETETLVLLRKVNYNLLEETGRLTIDHQVYSEDVIGFFDEVSSHGLDLVEFQGWLDWFLDTTNVHRLSRQFFRRLWILMDPSRSGRANVQEMKASLWFLLPADNDTKVRMLFSTFEDEADPGLTMGDVWRCFHSMVAVLVASSTLTEQEGQQSLALVSAEQQRVV